MRATRTAMFLLIFISVALAQSETAYNFKITNLDMGGNPINTYQWFGGTEQFLVDVENQNQYYNRQFELSALSSNWNSIVKIEELKNISHTIVVPNCATTCNPYLFTANSTIHMDPNCSTSCSPYSYESWYPDYKPAKMHMIDGKSNTQKTESINIGKGETKRFRVTVNVPFNSSGKFDIGAYDVNDATLTLLDPWWDANWGKRTCYNVTDSSGKVLLNYQVNISVDTASLITASDLRADCNDSRWGNETESFDFWRRESCNRANTTYMVEVPYIAASGTSKACHYYANPSASTDAGNHSNTFPFSEDFEYADVITNHGWQKTGSGDAAVSNDYWTTHNQSLKIDTTSNSVIVNHSMPNLVNFTLIVWYWDNSSDTGKNDWLGIGPIGAGAQVDYYIGVYNGGHGGTANYSYCLDYVNWYESIVPRTTGWHKFTWQRYAGLMNISIDSTLINSQADTNTYAQIFINGGGATRESIVYYDGMQLSNLTLPQPSVAAGTEETPATLLTIHSPTAGTYLNNTILVNFTAVSPLTTQINYSVNVDGVKNVSGTVANNTPFALHLNFTTRGTKIITINANETSTPVTITLIFDNVTNTSYTTPAFEMSNQTFNLSIRSVYSISNVQLIWNSTQYSAVTQNSTNWYRILELPLVAVNNTNITLYWNYTVDANSAYQNTSATRTQVVILAYAFNTTTKDKSSYMEGGMMTLYSYIVNYTTSAPVSPNTTAGYDIITALLATL